MRDVELRDGDRRVVVVAVDKGEDAITAVNEVAVRYGIGATDRLDPLIRPAPTVGPSTGRRGHRDDGAATKSDRGTELPS